MTDRDFSNGIHAEMPHFGNSFVVKAQQVIYAGGGIKSSIEQNKLQKQVSEQTYLDNRQNLRFLLAGYYLDLFQLRNQELVYQKNIEQTRLLVKDMQAAYRQGTALKSDITRYELQLQNLELKQTSTTNKLNVLNHELVTTLGLEEGIRIVPDTAYLQRQLLEERDEKSWSEGIQEAPIMKLADIQIALGKNQKNLIKAERRPHISFSITNELSGPILIEVPPLNNNFTYWFMGVGVSYNIDALFKGKRKLKQADITLMKLQEKLGVVLRLFTKPFIVKGEEPIAPQFPDELPQKPGLADLPRTAHDHRTESLGGFFRKRFYCSLILHANSS